MSFFKIFAKFLLGLAALCAIPFVIELLLNSYEVSRNPWTKLGAIVTDGGPVREGINKRLFNEIRFRSTGMRIYFQAANLAETVADSLNSDVGGKVTVLKNNAELLSFNFRLENSLKKNVGGLDAKESLGSVGIIDIAQKFDVECSIVPSSPLEKAAADHLYKYQFGEGEAVEIDLKFEGNVPAESKVTFTYSKCPRSLLHGTFLEGFTKHFTQSNL